MISTKEIKLNILSIQNTRKITHAMELISANKMNKIYHNLLHIIRPYSTSFTEVIENILSAHLEYQHPFLKKRNIKNIGFVVISTDRGLCGNLNFQIFKLLKKKIQIFKEKKINSYLLIIGEKAKEFFFSYEDSLFYKINFNNIPKIEDIQNLVNTIFDYFNKEKVDEIYILYNKFYNVMKHVPIYKRILPIQINQKKEIYKKEKSYWDYIYEGNPKLLLEFIFSKYIYSQIYHSIIENLMCEHAARMLSMKNATENADEIINNLKLQYNKCRQFTITKELAEIISGSESI